MKTDAQLLKTFKIEKLEKNIIFVEMFGSESEDANNGRQAELVSEAIMKVVNQDPKTLYNFLVDMTLTGTVSRISPHAKEVYINLSKISNQDKAAVIGNNLMLEVSVNLLMQATGRGSSFKWFKDREEALEWLKTEVSTTAKTPNFP